MYHNPVAHSMDPGPDNAALIGLTLRAARHCQQCKACHASCGWHPWSGRTQFTESVMAVPPGGTCDPQPQHYYHNHLSEVESQMGEMPLLDSEKK